MHALQLIRRTVWYYRFSNLALILGVVAGTAVIGGALIVGDSVRDSLRDMTLARLGRIDYALHGQRFFREELAETMGARLPGVLDGDVLAPALWLNGSLEIEQSDGTMRRASKVNIVGLDERLWDLLEHGEAELPGEREVVVGSRVAADLGLEAGADLTLWVEIPETIPRDSLLGERDEVSQEVAATVTSVLRDSDGASRLDLNPGQQFPLTVFLSLDYLQSLLGLEEVRRSKRNPDGAAARVNTLFAHVADSNGREERVVARFNGVLDAMLTPTDLWLHIRQNEKFGYVSVESESLVLDAPIVRAAEDVARTANAARSPVLVYLVNELSNAEDSGGPDQQATECFSTYSVVAGIDLSQDAPFGPFQFMDGAAATSLKPNEILINDWLADDINVAPEDSVRTRYYAIGSHGELPPETQVFVVRGIVTLEDSPAGDPGITPTVRGITDADRIDDWERPFDMDMDRVTDRDEDYWKAWKATPKAFIDLKTAQKLWGSRHGLLTSYRIGPLPREPLKEDSEFLTLEKSAARVEELLAEALDPAELGLVFRPIKAEGLRASVGANNFTQLFVGFSFFLILAAAILMGLLFRLNIERRTGSIGLLSAVGLTGRQVRRVFVGEGLLLVLLGAIPGVLAAIGYAAIMMYGLRTWWVGATGTRFLELSLRSMSLLAALGISIAVSLVVVWVSVRRLSSFQARELLTGAVQDTGLSTPGRRWARLILVGCLVVSAGLIAGVFIGLVPSSEAFSGISWQTAAFFVVGLSLLSGGVAGVAWLLDAQRLIRVHGSGRPAVTRLAIRNASRNRQRSLFTVGLISFAAFVIVAVAAGRRNPAVEEPELDSGNGGFTIVAESDQPVVFDLGTADGRNELGFTAEDENAWPGDARVFSFQVKPGEDASCLNLYQTRLPTVLGVSDGMIERGGFRFADTPSAQPWNLLTTPLDPEGAEEPGQVEVPVIPVLGDMNTLQFSLKKGIGDVISIPDDENPSYKLQVVGMFDGSVFQGVLLMSDENFHQLYGEISGYQYFLVETPGGAADGERVATLLETRLAAAGMDAERVADRLAGFLAVQNTYLSTFQTLGGLGLLLGTLGLATVMLRNVVERRSELALLRAVGFGPRELTWLVLVENGLLLGCGLLLGTVAALVAMAPHLVKTGADLPTTSVAVIIGSVFVVGMLAALVAIREAITTPVLATLRAE